MQIAEDIVPIGDFKAHLSEQISGLKERGRPIVVTQNGRPAAVVMSPEEFDALTYQIRFMAAVQEGLADAEAGRLIDNDELSRQLETLFDSSVEAKPRK